MKFCLLLLLAVMAIFSGAAAGCFLQVCKRPALTALPRHRIAGSVLGAWVIFACVPHVMQLLEGSAFASPALLYGAATVLTILVFRFADYHFARGLSVVLIYVAYLMLREGYALHPAGYPVFAVLFFLTGSLGIVLASKPVWMRDWLESAQKNGRVRQISVIAFAVAAVSFLAAFCSVALTV